ncbi:DinB family protein [Nocardioides sp.]|uniref:DinB family protein n=1 Tax=Nocardioides sp. TaxID=35761 RepID=UPI002735D22F|nr:DinB family protein [Nocardioides sp.]MDP3893740.1 DinB family protein [Nocardioides sp.]
MTDHRPEPPLAGDEASTLLGFLDFLRATILDKADGLDAAQLDQRLAPSTMTLGGMLKHLALVEDWWFSCVLLGNEHADPFHDVDWKADADWDWHSATEDTPDELRDLLARFVEESRAITADTLAGADGIMTLSVRTSRAGEQFSLRWILAHMIEEYARHAGHADLIRESIDGRTGE